ncbi:ABC transporter ATP-binding protein [Prescottella equi]|uniref:ABC transporter ATP-binding protein n=1 Tax=Rhodococcus hoagii TaxID=43767 RepID=UPI000A11C7F3|nr:ATP-binding cassette domain-containing protein [Prescottella equi]ORL78243.1 ABC transporter ATP-binding protein [Prescottella equi]BCN51703.1 ABC transporter ATP-binding protein [Prescottella equi]BCN76422.1 ABC transporter ATP-binding protein [Prescottella equi]
MTTSTAIEPLLEVRGLSKSYGGVKAVQDISFSVRPGEVVALVGPNGAGKTTLIDIVFGTQRADGGEVRLRGRPLTGSSERRARQGLARTFQHPQVALELTALENIVPGLFGREIGSFRSAWKWAWTGLSRTPDAALAAAADIATRYGISDVTAPCGDVSLGTRRLVEVARAMASEPAVMLLDEPFASGDPESIEAIAGAVRTIQESGNGVVLVDHNVDLVRELATSVVLLNFGEVAFTGPPDECLSSPAMREVYFGEEE